MKVAVTGAAGFLGINVVNALVADGHDVVAIDQVVTGLVPSERVTWVTGDILDESSMVAALDGVEVVYHLVAMITLKMEDPIAERINVEGVATVARAARTVGVRRMVSCGSLAAFRYHRGETVTEESRRSIEPELPIYHRSKYAGEVVLREAIDEGLDAVIGNPTGIFGPADHPTRLSRMNQGLADAAKGKLPVSVNGYFDMVDVRDVARGLILAGEHGRTGENYLLGGHWFGLAQAQALAAQFSGRPGPRLALPLSMLELVAPLADPIAQRFGSENFAPATLENITQAPLVDITKARTELGYDPRPTEDTIRDLIVFFVEHGVLDHKSRK